MYGELIEAIAGAGRTKADLLRNKPAAYFLLSMLAGLYVGLGILLIFTIGGVLEGATATRIVMGVSFGIALSLVIMAGSELFTGNNLILTVSSLEKKTTWAETASVWGVSYLGNLAGSLALALCYAQTGLGGAKVGEFIMKAAETKMALAWQPLFYRGLLCNILVCLAVLCAVKLKSESGKLIMIFWCLFAFITSGFEHSIANMTLLGVALFLPHPETITVAGFAYNLFAVTIGNMVGGALVLGVPYWIAGRKR